MVIKDHNNVLTVKKGTTLTIGRGAELSLVSKKMIGVDTASGASIVLEPGAATTASGAAIETNRPEDQSGRIEKDQSGRIEIINGGKLNLGDYIFEAPNIEGNTPVEHNEKIILDVVYDSATKKNVIRLQLPEGVRFDQKVDKTDENDIVRNMRTVLSKYGIDSVQVSTEIYNLEVTYPNDNASHIFVMYYDENGNLIIGIGDDEKIKF